MRIHFLGAAKQVTGSRYCLEVGDKRLLIDCGLFQERDFVDRNWKTSPVPADKIDAVLLTHAHIDHSGLLPRLYTEGFRGPIITTRGSHALCKIMLLDSAKIQMEDAAYKKKRHKREKRKGQHPESPLYNDGDAEKTLKLFQGVDYLDPVPVVEGVTVTFHDAGHILGSAMLELVVCENGQERRVVFSGDIGQDDKPLIRDPSILTEADYLVMESTYGDKDHLDGGDIESQLESIVQRTVERGGNVVVPTFAVERAQELMFYFGKLVRADRIPNIPVFLDSPMAVDVTEIFRKFHEYFDEETWDMISSKTPPLRFPNLHFSRTVSQSRGINDHHGSAIIMSTSGMCTAGRIKHHLRRNLPDEKNTILFVGFQGRGTLGRLILDGATEVRIHGQKWPVSAEIAQIFGFSAHADRSDLLRWMSNFGPKPKTVFLTHGEESAAIALADLLVNDESINAYVPNYQEVVELE